MNTDAGTRWREGLAMTGVTLLVLVALPILAVLLFVTRAVLFFTLLLAAAAGVAAFALSERFRRWLELAGQTEVSYKGLRLATNVALAPGHVWARVTGTEASVGVDDMVPAVLGPIDGVELPDLGRTVLAGEKLFTLRHGGRVLETRSPLTGTVLSVNEALREEPQRINKDPFAAGWAVRLTGDRLKRERQGLKRGLNAQDWFRGEVDCLLAALGPAEPLPVLADGGVAVQALYRQIDDATWSRLKDSFFGWPPTAALTEEELS